MLGFSMNLCDVKVYKLRRRGVALVKAQESQNVLETNGYAKAAFINEDIGMLTIFFP